jgi:hypothetical protein
MNNRQFAFLGILAGCFGYILAFIIIYIGKDVVHEETVMYITYIVQIMGICHAMYFWDATSSIKTR